MKILSPPQLKAIANTALEKIKMLTPKQRIALSTVLVLLIAGGGYKYYQQMQNKAQNDAAIKTTVVGAEEVGRKTLRKVFQLYSALLPWKESSVKPLAVGFVEEMSVQVGDSVKKNQVLYRLDSESQRLRAELERLDFEVKRTDYKVSMALAKKNFISKQEENQKGLENRATEIRARLSMLENRGISRAPFDGLVSEIGFKVGDYLDSSSNATLRVVDLSKMKVSFWIPQSLVSKVNKNSELRLQMDEVVSNAKLIAISPTVDQKTGSVFVEAELTSAPPAWKAGQFVQVLLSLESAPNVLAVPRAALLQENGHSYIWKIERTEANRELASADSETLARKIEVVTGLVDDDWIEVKSGLEEFDQIIVQGIAGLSDGTRVEISEDR